MKKIIIVFAMTLLLMSTVLTPRVFVTKNNEAETIINQYIKYIKLNKWDEYVELFNYDIEVQEHLLMFLKDSKNQSNKQGIHGIKSIKLVSIELSSDPEFESKGDYVYDVLLDTKVHNPSEFYMNGVTHHVFVFNTSSDGLQLENVYFKGLVVENNFHSTSNRRIILLEADHSQHESHPLK